MKCCFCGAELKEERYALTYDVAVCPNKKCDVYDQEINVKVWQALISGKKAQETLEQIKDICESGRYADTLNFNLDSADIRNIYLLVTSITKGDKE